MSALYVASGVPQNESTGSSAAIRAEFAAIGAAFAALGSLPLGSYASALVYASTTTQLTFESAASSWSVSYLSGLFTSGGTQPFVQVLGSSTLSGGFYITFGSVAAGSSAGYSNVFSVNLSAGTVIVRLAGRYRVRICFTCAVGTGADYQLSLYKNSNSDTFLGKLHEFAQASGVTITQTLSVETELVLASGDTLQLAGSSTGITSTIISWELEFMG